MLNEVGKDILIIGLILLPFQWLMIFSVGYCYVWPIQYDLSLEKKQKKTINQKRRWRNKDYKLCGFLLIIVVLILLGVFAYEHSYKNAKNKRYSNTDIHKKN